MSLFKKSLAFQILLVLLRPAVFIWSVSTLIKLNWASSYLIFVGYIPFFAVIDVLFQSIARHQYLTGFKIVIDRRSLRLPLFLAMLVVAGAFSVGVADAQSIMLAYALFISYVLSSCANIFESNFSSSGEIFRQAIIECSGYVLCFLAVFIWSDEVGAIAFFFVYPLTRVMISYLTLGTEQSVASSMSRVPSRLTYVSLSIVAQLVASISGSIPSLLLALGFIDRSDLGRQLIYFKLLFTFSSGFSILVNLVGSRLAYGNLVIDLSYYKKILVRVDLYFIIIVCLFLATLPIMQYVLPGVFSFWLLGVVCAALAYLNVVCSLGFARGQPTASAVSQLVGFFGAVSFALLLLEGLAGISILYFFIILFICFRSRFKLVDYLMA